MKTNSFFTVLLLLLTFTACQNNKDSKATLVVINARIWTGNTAQTWAEALAVRGDSLVFVGDTEGGKKWIDANTKVIDAQGKMVTPGFIDSHVHFLDGGFNLTSVQLRDAKTKAEFIKRIADFAKTVPAGTWITGGDWDHQNWGGELPQAAWVDSITPNNPLWLNRLDGHMSLANSAAMRLANISAQTSDIKGGEIIRDAQGKPTGVFKDNAMDYIYKVVADPPKEMKDRALVNAMQFVASKGVTSVQHMGTWDELATFRRAREQGTLTTRIYANVPLSTWARLRDEVATKGLGDKWLRIGGLKGFVDGSLGSHTAAMLAPFSDKPSDSGLFVTPLDSLFSFTLNADKNKLQVMVHAIGDKAIREQLTVFENVEKQNGRRDRRFRIEHAQHIHPQDIARFAMLKVIPSMQPYHAIDDGRWAEKVIGHERCRTTYAFKSLIDAGANLAFGSDWFVAPPTPLEGMYAAVTRRTLDDKNPNGWMPEQKITVEQALRAYTMGAAFASFEEKIKGSLEVGKLADFVILEKDLTNIAPETIRDVKVIATYVGGKAVFEAK
ncbi:MAG: amidohydrolase [Saprospiraceae bacterium]|nr:amidohydrolase [Saprospiraceae bacterium]